MEEKEFLEKKIDVLDHGFVRLVDYMGDDTRIVDAARVAYSKGTKKLRTDASLIDYLIREDHGSPMEKVVFEFHIKAPLFVATHFLRHRIGSFNFISGRYSVMPDEVFIPEFEHIKPQSTDNKQGRNGGFDKETTEYIQEALKKNAEVTKEHYADMLQTGLARELARIDLPVSQYTEFYWTVNLRSLMNFLKLRMDSHAQYETREFANAIFIFACNVAPLAMEAFEHWVLDSVRFSATEMYWLETLFTEENIKTMRASIGGAVLTREFDRFMKKIGIPT